MSLVRIYGKPDEINRIPLKFSQNHGAVNFVIFACKIKF